MSQTTLRNGASVNSPMTDLFPPELAKMGKQSAEAIARAQQDFMATVEEMNRDWLVRVQSEAQLASELAAKLAAARSMPDAASVYQEWMGQRIAMLAEDSQRMWAKTQKFMKAGAWFLPNGGSGH
jgi:predicted phage tail protein